MRKRFLRRDRLTNDTAANNTVLLNQAGSSQLQRSGYETGLGFDWDLNKHNSFSGSVSYENFSHTGISATSQSQITKDISGNILSDIENSIGGDNAFHFHNIDAGLNYKKNLQKGRPRNRARC